MAAAKPFATTSAEAAQSTIAAKTMTPIQRQPLMAPLAAGGGIVAGVSAAFIGWYQLSDCMAFRTKRGECDQIASVAIPAMVAGAGSIIGAIGGLWTLNPRLRSGGAARREQSGRNWRARTQPVIDK